jgi:hypothetical protein
MRQVLQPKSVYTGIAHARIGFRRGTLVLRMPSEGSGEVNWYCACPQRVQTRYTGIAHARRGFRRPYVAYCEESLSWGRWYIKRGDMHCHGLITFNETHYFLACNFVFIGRDSQTFRTNFLPTSSGSTAWLTLCFSIWRQHVPQKRLWL